MPINLEPRRIVLENVFNLRDLGGYGTTGGQMVVDGQIYRADGLNRLNATDAEVVRELGIRTVVDLRTEWERTEHGSAPTDLLGATGLHLPIISELWPLIEITDDHDPVAYLIERYHEMTIEGAASLATIISMIATDDAAVPLVFHCSAGKDRTGVVAAVLLGLLGVPDDVIAADAATEVAMVDLAAWVRAKHPTVDTMTTQPSTFLQCPIEAMEGFLGQIAHTFGSIAGYVESIGVPDETVEALRVRYLTD